MNDRLGLKGFWKSTKGMGLTHRLKRLQEELEFAWQRAYRGWDDSCIWNMDSTIRIQLVEWLKVYRNNHHGSWWCPDGYEIGEYYEDADRYILTDKQMNAIIDTIIFHFQMADEDFCEKQLYGTCIEDDDYKIGCKTLNDYKRIEAVRKQNQDLGLELLKKVFNQLWD